MKSVANFSACAVGLVFGVVLSLSQNARADDATRATRCLGTEPFWSLDINPETLSFEDFEGNTMTIANRGPRAAAGQMVESLALYQGRIKEDPSRFMNVIVTPRRCSDGMSDTTYPYEVLVLSGSTLFRGCCNRVSR